VFLLKSKKREEKVNYKNLKIKEEKEKMKLDLKLRGIKKYYLNQKGITLIAFAISRKCVRY
jgi:aspartyl aminopeptidase